MKVYINIQNSCIYSLLYGFLQISFILIPPSIVLKTFHSKSANRLAISLFSVEDSAGYVATGYVPSIP